MGDRRGAGIGGAAEGDEDPRADLTWGTIPHLVEDGAARFGHTEALVDGAHRLTFGDLAPAVDRYARGFMAAGVGPGERVALWAPNCAEWMLSALGAVRAGAVLVPLNTRFKGPEASYVLRAAGASTLVTVRGFLGVDYPALLDGEDVGGLSRTVLLRDEGTAARGGLTGLTGLDAFLGAADRVEEGASARRTAGIGPDDVADIIWIGGLAAQQFWREIGQRANDHS